jgi:2-oxoglutarate dehydrogenase E1 component
MRYNQKQVSVLQLINAHRFLGTRWAQLDPLKRTERPEIHELELSHYGFTEADLNETFNTGSFHGLPSDRPPCARSSTPCARPTAAPSAPSTCT